jgi:hypothetical protein
MKFKVVLSTPLGFSGMVIKFEDVDFPKSLSGTMSYCGHPNTKSLLEALGTQSVDLKNTPKWEGPSVGESYLAVPLVMSNRHESGYTKDVAVQDIAELKAILCTRIA